MIESARLAADDELPTVALLAAEARAEIEASKGGPMYLRREGRALPYLESFEAQASDERGAVVVGLIDASIVAFATVSHCELRDGAQLAEIQEIYVLPDARGVGIGEFMLDVIMDWARERGCERLEGSVLPGNRHGKNFFERAAMVTRVLRVSTALGPADD